MPRWQFICLPWSWRYSYEIKKLGLGIRCLHQQTGLPSKGTFKEIKFGKANKLKVPNVEIVDWRERPATMLGQVQEVEEKKPEPVAEPEPDYSDDLDF